MRIFLIIFWGIFAALTTVATIYVLINYEVQRWKDKLRLREGIYIRRVTRLEVLVIIILPIFPALMVVYHMYEPGIDDVVFEMLALLLPLLGTAYLRYVHVAYVKTSADGIEQRIWFSDPTRYPINAIDSIVYYETLNVEDQDTVGFYTRSGELIAAFGPLTHKNYRLMAIVRFRIEQERWPDMNNPADVAQVDKLDNGYMTIPYFRSREKVTGLTDVDM